MRARRCRCSPSSTLRPGSGCRSSGTAATVRSPASSAATSTATTSSSTPLCGRFPPAFVVRPEGDAGAAWVRANVDFALAQAESSPLGPDAVSTRLPEMLLVEVLRQHLATAPAADHGWLAALHDPVLSPALARSARSTGAQVDRHRPRPGRRGVAVGPGRAVPAGAGTLPHPLPHRVADAPRRGPADLHRPRRRGHRPPGRVRRRRRRSAGLSSGTAAPPRGSGGQATRSGRPE